MAIIFNAAVEALNRIGSVAVIVVDLRPTQKSRPDFMQFERVEDPPRRSSKRVGPNDGHFSTKNIHQYRNLVDTRPAQELTESCSVPNLVGSAGECLFFLTRGRRSKLEYLKCLIIYAIPLMSTHNTPRRFALDSQRNEKHERRKQQ